MRPAVSAARAKTMGARAIVVSHVPQEYMTQMAFAKPHDIINAFLGDRADLSTMPEPRRLCVLKTLSALMR